MIDPIWSWCLTAFAVTAIWVGPRRRWGWIVGVVGQGVWFVYGIHSHQPGFTVSAVLLATAYTRNFVNAGKTRRKPNRIGWSSSHRKMIGAKRVQTQRQTPLPTNPPKTPEPRPHRSAQPLRLWQTWRRTA
jgi:hypothetical protein